MHLPSQDNSRITVRVTPESTIVQLPDATARMALDEIRDASGIPALRAATRIRLAVSDVAWDKEMLRLKYLTENDSTIYTRIVPRRHAGDHARRRDLAGRSVISSH